MVSLIKRAGKFFSPNTAQPPTYKKYVALLSQSGTEAPVATVLENTIGDITWSRAGVGDYRANLSGAFTMDKTVVFTTTVWGAIMTFGNQGYDAGAGQYSEDFATIYTADINNAGALIDQRMDHTSVEIRVYQ